MQIMACGPVGGIRIGRITEMMKFLEEMDWNYKTVRKRKIRLFQNRWF